MSKLLKLKGTDGEEVLLDDLYYKKGDTFAFSGHAICGGLVSSSTKTCVFAFPVIKRVPTNLKITVSVLNAAIRTTAGGYLDSKADSSNDWMIDGYTVAAYPSCGNTIRVAIVKNEEFTNVTNNTPICAWVKKLTIAFS